MTEFTDSGALAAWSEGAEAWDVFVESGADYYRHEVHGPALLAACGLMRRQRVLDLGCGQGYFSRQLASSGAQVLAVDIAPKLLALAEARETRDPLGVEYRQLSAAAIANHWPPDSFDLVAACMSL